MQRLYVAILRQAIKDLGINLHASAARSWFFSEMFDAICASLKLRPSQVRAQAFDPVTRPIVVDGLHRLLNREASIKREGERRHLRAVA